LTDAGEAVGFEAGAADEGAVDVGLAHEFEDRGWFDRAAVLDAN